MSDEEKPLQPKYEEGLTGKQKRQQRRNVRKSQRAYKKAKKEGKKLSGDYYDMIAKERMDIAKKA